MWPVLKAFDERYRLGMRFHDQELIAELPENGSQIFCVGGDDSRKVEALRGPKLGRAVVDEYGSFGRQLGRYLIEDVLDAALIGAAQRVEHYEMAGYGTARTHALRLGYVEAASILQQTLEEEGDADKKLTRIAESHVNAEAINNSAMRHNGFSE
jgi:hypothetical protein